MNRHCQAKFGNYSQIWKFKKDQRAGQATCRTSRAWWSSTRTDNQSDRDPQRERERERERERKREQFPVTCS